ncbi:helix-turn-helix domain-containing protein [Phytoactinopolyspora alkaliphila]|uniref:Helix-turn-helix domain-containing protein n=1 Tax=Phytoactinopolyspora alkaliphila TaxID=1783498 RepID=A0A6N9YJT9_9ACTN|nr:helix-turn-helix domain-containing protein [Phytoactinopolyspora alkaliphila]NED95321.1 helix-turn-helix domain-containing protein [Phytoactinopolyspora alkaliphila]
MMWYRPVPVAADMRSALVCRWTARPTGRHLLVPDACVDVLWLNDGRIVVCGPETTAWSFGLPAGAETAGVRLRPGVAAGLFRVSARQLLNRRVGLEDLIGSAPARRLAERLGEAGSLDARAVLLEEAAGRWLADRGQPEPFSANLTAALARRSWSIADLADAVGTTDRQLQRRSRDTFGYPPSTLRGILRLQRFMALASSPNGAGADLASLAYLAGYADQAHLSHDTRRIAASTPRQLLSSEAPGWHGSESVVERPAPEAQRHGGGRLQPV